MAREKAKGIQNKDIKIVKGAHCSEVKPHKFFMTLVQEILSYVFYFEHKFSIITMNVTYLGSISFTRYQFC